MKRDPAWDLFKDWLVKRMKEESLNSVQLAQLLTGVADADMVRRWRAGRGMPDLKDLPVIAEALSVSPAVVAGEMRILPRDSMEKVQTNLAIRLMKLQQQFHDLDVADTRNRVNSAHADLISALTDSQVWSIAIQPTFGGVPGERFRIADRYVLRRTDQVRARSEDLPAAAVEALHRLRAQRSGAPGWPIGKADKRASTRTKGALRYSAEVLARPRPPEVTLEGVPGFVSILVLSTTVRAWAGHISSHLADAFGFGLTSNRDMAAMVRDRAIPDTSTTEWAEFAEQLIEYPPVNYVCHISEPGGLENSRTLRTLRRFLETPSLIVWLWETDRVLEYASRHRTRPLTISPADDLELMLRHRADIDALLDKRVGRVIVREVDIPGGIGDEPTREDLSSYGADTALENAAWILARIDDEKWVNIDELFGGATPPGVLAAKRAQRIPADPLKTLAPASLSP